MMANTAIRVDHLSKVYRISHSSGGVRYNTLRDDVVNLARKLTRPSVYRRAHEEVWALNDVSFQVGHGEAIGIVGRNGAGKSTLLKILSRITDPTHGYADIYGRVGSLLEVGTGFHPELTGRENVFLNGAVLGMTRQEIKDKFDEIVQFAQVEKFLDTPVKRFSSGMHMRLAFAVAAHLEPEILVIDEVLAVGDAEFQKRSLAKMEDVAKGGRTVLFVSHNMAAVQSFCQQAIWLEEGRIVEIGLVSQVISNYLKSGASSLTEQIWEDFETAPGNDKVRLRRVAVRPLAGSPQEGISTETDTAIEVEFWNLDPGARLNLSLVLRNEQGIAVLNTFPVDGSIWHGGPFPAGLFRSICHMPGDLLNDGLHHVDLYVILNRSIAVYRQDGILSFEVIDSSKGRGGWHGKWIGVVRPHLEWETDLIQEGLHPLPR